MALEPSVQISSVSAGAMDEADAGRSTPWRLRKTGIDMATCTPALATVSGGMANQTSYDPAEKPPGVGPGLRYVLEVTTPDVFGALEYTRDTAGAVVRSHPAVPTSVSAASRTKRRMCVP